MKPVITNPPHPSKFISEEHNMFSLWKHNKKRLSADEMKGNRVALFNQLLEVGKMYRRVNQYE